MFKFVCPSCGKETYDTTETVVVRDGDLVECNYCYEVFTIKIKPEEKVNCPKCDSPMECVEAIDRYTDRYECSLCDFEAIRFRKANKNENC